MFNKNDMDKIWEDVRNSFVDETKLAPSAIDLWFGELEVEDFKDDKITLSAISEFKMTKIREKFIGILETGFENYLGFPVDVEVILRGAEGVENLQTEEEKQKWNMETNTILKATSVPAVNFVYNFENFIEGSSNTFARAACWAVAQNVVDAEEGNTASQYNPLFLYGPSGIGKTHLMNAIINKINAARPEANIVYIKGEDFTNQMIDSLARQAMPQFREKYRHCDILMIDDIQFISSKVATQEEFFHTFNALYENEKQIIMTSDRPPREIPDLEQRLVTRFEMGLLADIQPPDLELRIAIIKKKAEQGKITLSDEVLTFLAENLRSNIRQIEGAIKKLSALSFLSGKQITLELAKNLIHELLGGAEPVSVTVDKIFLSAFKKYGFKKDDLIGARRTKELAAARHVCIYLIRNMTEMSLPNIGKIFGRDHSTIMASIDIVEKRLQTDGLLSLEIEQMQKEVEGNKLP